MIESSYGWGVVRDSAVEGQWPFILCRVFTSRKLAQDFILETYGDRPNRAAALRRARRQEGIRALRVKVSAFGDNGGAP